MINPFAPVHRVRVGDCGIETLVDGAGRVRGTSARTNSFCSLCGAAEPSAIARVSERYNRDRSGKSLLVCSVPIWSVSVKLLRKVYVRRKNSGYRPNWY